MDASQPDLRVFSDTLWARPDVEAACLRLQEQFGADANLILFALDLTSTGRAVDAQTRARAIAIAADWTPSVITPLRAARRALKQRDPSLYARAKALELDAEWALQAALQAVADAAPQASADDGQAVMAAIIGEAAANSGDARSLLAAVPRRGARL